MVGCVLIFGLGLLIVFKFTVVQGQSTAGFISIDCGLAKNQNYTDSRGVPYISDHDFIDAGETHVVSSNFLYPNDFRSTLRSFPNGTRNCYDIKTGVNKGRKYIVRTRFAYGNYDGLNKPPQFDLYLGIIFWQTMSFPTIDDDYDPEILVVAVSNSFSICLVNTKQGTPFISAIEFIPFTEELYLEANTSQSLILFNRINLGGVRVSLPDDKHDRFWLRAEDYNIDNSYWSKLEMFDVINTSSFQEPAAVMQSCAYPITGSSLDLMYSKTPVGHSCPSTRVYFVLYFAELDTFLSGESRILHVSVDNVVVSKEIQPQYLKTTTFDKSISFSSDQLTISVQSTLSSTERPILNAVEVYRIIDMTCQSETRSLDVEAMMAIKEFYKMSRNWVGDPCAPKDYMWEGLNCSSNGSSSPLITSLNLSSSGLSGGIADSLTNLSALQYLDLSSNSLTGEIPDFLSRLSQLKVLNLANNRLNGSIPKVLLDMSDRGQLNLSTGGNPNLCINPPSCTEESSKKSNKLVTIVVSCIVVVVLVLVSIVVWRSKRKRSTVSVPSSDAQGNNTVFPHHLDCTQFSYSEIEKITDNFVRQIGKGGFGPVYHGIYKNDVQVAVKMLSHSSLQGVKEFQTEAKLLSRIHHKNLVALIGFCDDDNEHLALVYEYMEGGSLEDNLSGKGNRTPLSWSDRLRIAYGAAQGLEYLHKYCRPSIVHRDVKTSNILLTKKLEGRIADFGLSRLFQDDEISHMSTRVVGTPGYLDPEYHNTNQLSERSDLYSFGVVLMELITGLPAIIRQNENIHIIQWIQQRLAGGDVSEIVDKRIQEDCDVNSVRKLVEVANACTNFESVRRPDTTNVVAVLKDCLELSVAYENDRISGTANRNLGSSFCYEMIAENNSSMVNANPR